MQPTPSNTTRHIRIFRYDPHKGGSGDFQEYTLRVDDEIRTTILDVLLRLQREQDPTLAFRYACRVNMCGSCGMVINGKERLACKTNVSDIRSDEEITIRPLNHFPVIKDLVVDMDPFFKKYEEALTFYEPKEHYTEPLQIRPDSTERLDIGMATECIACGCCVSSCTMCNYHDEYAGPAALTRAFTLLADSRDALFHERLERTLASCYNCRTEFNCTEVCPKGISGTRAIKYIQRLALKHLADARKGEEIAPATNILPQIAKSEPDRRVFFRQVGIGVLGLGAALIVGGVATKAAVGPGIAANITKTWVPVADLGKIPIGDISTHTVHYELKNGFYTQEKAVPVLVSRTGDEMTCFNASCTHAGCIVKWDGQSGRFRCACHGGMFDREGNVLAGPPPRPLDKYPFKVDSGHLLIEMEVV
ncbi:succinate dehydrogenase iron-sulfur subunit [Desulfomonile tiedjei]|uniref:Succinate dehydrogenase and fumarate reductase iron-sulfur protein n=1 Tax=Desulfomonile tiedjei (strain ATCC 49306 / DSM 6799 / DCB-1) TaxID=706587 RepID=I4C4V7_DESTA|nr:succinate dehydrogenase iron-sulfur subunit [Desulfomonile tiedjei]AFM24598.1 succinate dehydrogenase and fumarate reductase iron-sulfur protein [Desulfomonile tiedjei DSM 6799]